MRKIIAIATFLFFYICNGVFAQQISNNIAPIVARNNVTIVYNTSTGQPDMVVLDANNLTDPSFNPPGTKQISVPVVTYNAITNPTDFQTYMATAITNDIAVQAAVISENMD